MMILCFDATAATCAVALYRGQVPLAARAEALDKGHAERLFPLIEDVMADAGVPLAAVEAIAVCTGPGNFTGARIGVAAARGLALSLGIPAVGVDRFEAAASGDCCIVLQGRGGAVHAARFRGGVPEGEAETIQAETLTDFAKGLRLCHVEDTDLSALARVATARLAAGEQPRPAPRYLRPVNAALPAAPPPPILP